MRKAIVLMAVGDSYVRLFESNKSQFERYARKTGADLILCKRPPDPSNARNLLAQKMLLPEMCHAYDWMAFLDLDILISNTAPSIFDGIDEGKAFAAVLDPRGSEKFKNLVRDGWQLPEILKETNRSYFTDRGYADHQLLRGSINGGIFVCKPAIMGPILKDAYYSDFREQSQGGSLVKRPAETYEEGMMAYLSQTQDLFFALDERFNTQVIFELYDARSNAALRAVASEPFEKLTARSRAGDWPQATSDYPEPYVRFVQQELQRCYILHFSGGMPFHNIL